jgi:hypothetical protein
MLALSLPDLRRAAELLQEFGGFGRNTKMIVQ